MTTPEQSRRVLERIAVLERDSGIKGISFTDKDPERVLTLGETADFVLAIMERTIEITDQLFAGQVATEKNAVVLAS